MRILIVEDQRRLADTLADIISENNDTADVAYDGVSGLDHALSEIYDAIILDVMLPGMDGFAIVKKLREVKISTPVLMLTAKSELSDRITGLDSGADYYLTKPFEKDELLACLRAILRRSGEIYAEKLTFEDLTLNLSTCELQTSHESVRLSAKELEIIRMLMENKGMILSKENILLKVWGYDSDAEANNVEVYISFLRKKLDHIQSSVSIGVIRRVGYRLEVGRK